MTSQDETNNSVLTGEPKAETPLLDAMRDAMTELIQGNGVIHITRVIAHVEALMMPLALQAIDQLALNGKITVSGKGGGVTLAWLQS